MDEEKMQTTEREKGLLSHCRPTKYIVFGESCVQEPQQPKSCVVNQLCGPPSSEFLVVTWSGSEKYNLSTQWKKYRACRRDK